MTFGIETLLQKNRKNFLNTMKNNFLENSLPLLRNRKKEENIPLTYDVSDHIYSKTKSHLIS